MSEGKNLFNSYSLTCIAAGMCAVKSAPNFSGSVIFTVL